MSIWESWLVYAGVVILLLMAFAGGAVLIEAAWMWAQAKRAARRRAELEIRMQADREWLRSLHPGQHRQGPPR